MNEYEQHLRDIEATILWEEAKQFEFEVGLVRQARAELAPITESYWSWIGSVWTIRDLQVTKDAGLDGLCWAMVQESCVHSEAEWVLDELIAYTERVTKPDFKPDPPERKWYVSAS